MSELPGTVDWRVNLWQIFVCLVGISVCRVSTPPFDPERSPENCRFAIPSRPQIGVLQGGESVFYPVCGGFRMAGFKLLKWVLNKLDQFN